MERRREREPLQLLGHRLDHRFVAVAEAGDEDAGEAVDVALSLAVCEPDPLSFREDQRILRELLHLHEIEEQRGNDLLRAHEVLLLQCGGPLAQCLGMLRLGPR